MESGYWLHSGEHSSNWPCPPSTGSMVMEQVGEKVGRIKNEEASRGKTVEGRDGQEEEKTTEGPLRKYPWWSPATMIGKTTGPSDKMEDTASLFEGKNMRV